MPELSEGDDAIGLDWRLAEFATVDPDFDDTYEGEPEWTSYMDYCEQSQRWS